MLVATGPLTEGALADEITRLTGGDKLSFYDAAAPIVTAESLDMNKVFAASRYGRGDADYLNCPFNKEEYEAFHAALVSAEKAPLHEFDGKLTVYEGCMPIEVMASRGADTMRFGPLRPVGLRDPKREYKLDDGELCIRGDSVMMGYYKDPAATAEVLDAEGWLHTGDLARIDERGYIFLTGRKKNVIILGSGENVSPEELEAKLNQCPDVTESLIREENGKIGALVWCGETGEAKQAAVQSYVTELNRTLPLYKRIAAVHLAEGPLPRNAAGKLLRK